MFDRNDRHLIWVTQSDEIGDGTYENPYNRIEKAVADAQPGDTIVLKAGIYQEDVTIQISGTPERPIRITCDDDAYVEIQKSCFFFYDTSDFIVTNLTFKEAAYGAISVIGNCQRNRFANIRFVNCGYSKKTACTLYFGGSGGQCNLVEDCRFERDIQHDPVTLENASIALMVAEGDLDNDPPLSHHLFRRNYISNYGYAILIGTQGTSTNSYSHIVEYNQIENCASEGILVKCGDTQIRGNLISKCPNNSICVAAGDGSIVENNRILDCGKGIRISGAGHTVSNNCIVRCTQEAVRACASVKTPSLSASNLLIENNTCVNCGTHSTNNVLAQFISGIAIEQGATCIIQHNLFSGTGKPYGIITHETHSDNLTKKKKDTHCVVHDNLACGECEIMEGVVRSETVFEFSKNDNYQNDSGYGAKGWMLTPEAFDPNMDLTDDEIDYREASILENDKGELIVPGTATFKDSGFVNPFETNQIETNQEEKE